MHTLPENRPHSLARSRPGTITFYTLLCFALAGLIGGFAIGGFASHLSRGSTSNLGLAVTRTPTLNEHTPQPSTTTTVENVSLGLPSIGTNDYTSPEIADGTTSYRLAAQITNEGDGTPITATDVTCRLWLTDNLQATSADLSANNYAIPRNPSAFNQPFPDEVIGALNFIAPSQQTQPCAANDKTSWSYTLASSVQRGIYYLVVLADWRGAHYNWSLIAIRVHDGNNRGH